MGNKKIAPPVPCTEQGEGYFARTPCYTIDLIMHPSGVLPLLCCYYYIITLPIFFFPINYSLVSYLFHVSYCYVNPITTTTLSFCFIQVMLCTQLNSHVTSRDHIFVRLPYCIFICVPVRRCQLFTDEGSQRLLKRLNNCFSVLSSATNQSI